MNLNEPNPRQIFVVHGRDKSGRISLFAFLRAIGLEPIEFSQAIGLTGKGTPTISEILDVALCVAQAIVVLLTPDDFAYLRAELLEANDPDHERSPHGQPRANVLFEAGLAMGRDENRTILVELGRLRPFSDIAGRHVVRFNDRPETRIDLANRLRAAGCEVRTDGYDWLYAGTFALASQEPTPQRRGEPRKDHAAHGAITIEIRRTVPYRFLARIETMQAGGIKIRSLSVEPADSFVIATPLPLPYVLEASAPADVQIVQVSKKEIGTPKVVIGT
jgi:hypothetical protein